MEFSRVGIDDAVNFYLDELIIKGYKDATLKIYSDVMGKFTEFLTSELKYIDSVTKKHISMFRIFLRKVCNMTQSLIDRAVSCLRTFYKTLTEMHIIPFNVMEEFKHTRESKKNLPISLEIEELEEIIIEMDDENKYSQDISKVIFTLVAETGSPRSTILNLKWSDVDFYRGLITLDKSNLRKCRTLKMSKKLYDVLWNFKEGLSQSSDTYILKSKHNKQLSASRFTTLFKKVVKKWEQTNFNLIYNSRLDEDEKKRELSRSRLTSTVVRNTLIKFLVDRQLDIALVKNAVGLLSYKSIKRFK